MFLFFPMRNLLLCFALCLLLAELLFACLALLRFLLLS